MRDRYFVVEMTGYPGQSQRHMLIDVPASCHNGAGTLNFADGHAEIRRWMDPRTQPKLTDNSSAQHIACPNNPDLDWLQARSSAAEP